MTIVLHAQPYDISASGFYFQNAEDFQKKVTKCRNDFDVVSVNELNFKLFDRVTEIITETTSIAPWRKP